MKIKVSVSMDEKTLQMVENKIKEGFFRNKSHFIEWATKKGLDEDVN